MITRVQPLKALLWTSISLSGNIIDTSDVQDSKAPDPKDISLLVGDI